MQATEETTNTTEETKNTTEEVKSNGAKPEEEKKHDVEYADSEAKGIVSRSKSKWHKISIKNILSSCTKRSERNAVFVKND